MATTPRAYRNRVYAEILRLQGYTMADIGKALGVSRQRIAQWLATNGHKRQSYHQTPIVAGSWYREWLAIQQEWKITV
jgi:transcriptional regulator with XRE-family HTH domain